MLNMSIGPNKAPGKRLKQVGSFSYGLKNTGNMIIHGNNNDVLATLGNGFLGQVSCIYLDPPYNNGEDYTHYSDVLTHDAWLLAIKATLAKIEPFLSDEGSVWISIDENEMHYLKVAADTVLGRKNFLTTIVWQQRITRENRRAFSNNHEYLLVYAKSPMKFRSYRNLLPITDQMLSRYKNVDDDPRGVWQSVSANVQDGHATKSQFYTLVAPNGKKHKPPNGRCWIYNKQRMAEEIRKNNIWFGKDGNGIPRVKKFLSKTNLGLTPQTLWFGEDVGTNLHAKKHLLSLLPYEKVFDTPKPEELLKRIIQIATKPGDLILDAYLGSGTTAAVAQKLGRRYIGIDVSREVCNYAVKRLKKVIDGESGGISAANGWKGGGGFDFYTIK